MKIETSHYIILVPRSFGGVRSYTKVKLELVHDRDDIPIKTTPLLEQSTEYLSTWKSLPEGCEVSVSITEILLFIMQRYQKGVMALH